VSVQLSTIHKNWHSVVDAACSVYKSVSGEVEEEEEDKDDVSQKWLVD